MLILYTEYIEYIEYTEYTEYTDYIRNDEYKTPSQLSVESGCSCVRVLGV